MAKTSAVDQAIAGLRRKIVVLELAIEELREQRHEQREQRRASKPVIPLGLQDPPPGQRRRRGGLSTDTSRPPVDGA